MSIEYKYDKQTDYNPTTDKFTKISEPRKDNGNDPEWEKHKNDLDIEAKLRIQEVEQESLDLYKNRAFADQKKQEYMRNQRELQIKAEQAKLDAIDLARERYLEKSGLYKLFHKRLSDKKATKMTAQEINNLYGGIEEEKGISR